MNKYLYLAAGIAGVTVVCFIKWIIARKEEEEPKKSCYFMCMMIGVLLICVNLLFYHTMNVLSHSHQNELQTALENDYPVLLDGKEVNVDDIDFDMYYVKVDMEKKKIFCTSK